MSREVRTLYGCFTWNVAVPRSIESSPKDRIESRENIKRFASRAARSFAS